MNAIKVFRAVAVAALVLAGVLPARAQTLTGSLSGTVVDSSDAVLPGATVTLVNELSGDQRDNASPTKPGNFVFAAVPAGTYTVKVELSGFQTVETKGIVLQTRREAQPHGDQAGRRRDSPSRSRSPRTTELAPVSSGEKSASITGEQIQNIAIVGRSAAELLKILPGMAPARRQQRRPGFNGEVYGINGNGEGGKQSAIGNYSAQRHQNNALDIVIDGAHGVRPGCNCATSVNPNPDMVEEFKVLQAELRRRERQGPDDDQRRVEGGRPRLPRHRLRLPPRLPLNSNEWFLNKVDGAGPSRRTSSRSRASTSAVRCSSRARTSTRTATSCSSSSATSTTSRTSTPAR